MKRQCTKTLLPLLLVGCVFGTRSLAAENDNATKIIAACESKWEANKADCNAFVKAVAGNFSFELTGNANAIVKALGESAAWTKLTDGKDAKLKADSGKLVIGGLKGEDQAPSAANGHVVIIVAGPLAHSKYPTGYWGKLNSVGKKKTTINFAWVEADRDKVKYFARTIE